jgi:hypothetical protein
MSANSIITAEGHKKIHDRKQQKRYLAVLKDGRRTRWSLRSFRTATKAEEYGKRLVARAMRFFAHPANKPEPVEV